MRSISILAALGAAFTASAAPVDVDTRAAYTAGVQMWSGPDFTGNYVHYAAPQITFDTCCKPSSTAPGSADTLTSRTDDITSRFPPNTAGGLTSVKADAKNRCKLYPSVLAPVYGIAVSLTKLRNTSCNPGSGNDEDELWVEGSYYDLSQPEYGWGDRAKSFKCVLCANCGN
jgi:hypothetical protein